MSRSLNHQQAAQQQQQQQQQEAIAQQIRQVNENQSYPVRTSKPRPNFIDAALRTVEYCVVFADQEKSEAPFWKETVNEWQMSIQHLDKPQPFTLSVSDTNNEEHPHRLSLAANLNPSMQRDPQKKQAEEKKAVEDAFEEMAKMLYKLTKERNPEQDTPTIFEIERIFPKGSERAAIKALLLVPAVEKEGQPTKRFKTVTYDGKDWSFDLTTNKMICIESPAQHEQSTPESPSA